MDTIDTLKTGERVTSKYAQNYFDGDDKSSSEYYDKEPSSTQLKTGKESNFGQNGLGDAWVSPSDLLIGIIELTPPFTSKITRGVTHEGIISIGNGMLVKERQKFEKELRQLLRDNDAAWNHVLAHEKQQVKQKVDKNFMEIFEDKRKIMTIEISQFYENSLQELEDHLRSEIQHVLASAHASIISDFNIEISKKLKEERSFLEKVLEKKYRSEIHKITQYYKLMSDYELNRNDMLIAKALQEKNDAINIFYKQIEAETITSTMYMMSMERKKCRIKQFLLENYQSSEIKQKLEKIKTKQKIIDSYKQNERFIADINLEWKEKIKKVIQLFLKFIGFSLKLLPEQTTFLLDLEKLFVLQLNEIQKQPESAPNILIEVDDIKNNIIHFEEKEPTKATCDKEPFEVVGDTSDSIPTPYGSRETLPSHVDLPAITMVRERKFVYAKCNKFDEIKDLVESQICKCLGTELLESSSHTLVSEPVCGVSVEPDQKDGSTKSESSIELMQVDDIKRMQDCPFRYCQDWKKLLSFDISQFVDFTEDNFKIVQNRFILPPERVQTPEVISAKEIAHRPLPFMRTPKLYRDAVTQCSSVEDMTLSKMNVSECTCLKNVNRHLNDSNEKDSNTKLINEMMLKRRISMQRLLFSNHNLLKMFTDESFNLKF